MVDHPKEFFSAYADCAIFRLYELSIIYIFGRTQNFKNECHILAFL